MLEWVRCPVCNDDRAQPLFRKDGFSIVGCRICGLRYVNPRPTQEWLDTWYRKEYFARTHAQNSAGLQHLRHGDIKIATAQLRLQSIRKFCAKGRLLDVGCAGGFFVQAAGMDGWAAVGLEPSVEAARRAAQDQRIQAVVGRLEQAPFAGPQFDLVTVLDVLEHVFCPRTFLVEARRLLAHAGTLLIETPNMAGWISRLMGRRHPYVRPPEHLTYFSPSTLRLLLEHCGFRVLRLSTRNHKVLTLEYALALTQSTNPFLTALVRGTIGRWDALRRYPLSVPVGTILAVARVQSLQEPIT